MVSKRFLPPRARLSWWLAGGFGCGGAVADPAFPAVQKSPGGLSPLRMWLWTDPQRIVSLSVQCGPVVGLSGPAPAARCTGAEMNRLPGCYQNTAPDPPVSDCGAGGAGAAARVRSRGELRSALRWLCWWLLGSEQGLAWRVGSCPRVALACRPHIPLREAPSSLFRCRSLFSCFPAIQRRRKRRQDRR